MNTGQLSAGMWFSLSRYRLHISASTGVCTLPSELFPKPTALQMAWLELTPRSQSAGMTKSQIATLVKKRLMEENLVNDPVVTVEFMNLYFSVLGEVKTPGKYAITKDQITLLEAISMAGDLSIYGKRDAIFVIREENGERVTHWVDIRSKDMFNSPVYYLKQNDVVYVQPNKVRAGQSTINENSVKSVSLWISIGSLLSSLGVLLFK